MGSNTDPGFFGTHVKKEDTRAQGLAPCRALTVYLVPGARGLWPQTENGFLGNIGSVLGQNVRQAGGSLHLQGGASDSGQSQVSWPLCRWVEGTAYRSQTVDDKYAQMSVGAGDRDRDGEAEGVAVGERDMEPGPGLRAETVGQGRARQKESHRGRSLLSAPQQGPVERTWAAVISSHGDGFCAGKLIPGCARR